MSDFQHPSFPGSGTISYELTQSRGGHGAALALALLGAGTVLLLFIAPWSLALAAAMAILILSAIENETFLIFVMLSMPFGWMLPREQPVRNMHVVFHLLVVLGFFAGRLWRKQLRLRHLIRPKVSSASLLFFCAAVVSTIIVREKLTHESVRADADLVAFVGFYFLVLSWVDSRERLRKVLGAVLISTIVTALFAFFQELAGGFTALGLYLYPPEDSVATWEGRAASLLGTPNNLAGYLNLVLPFSLACYVLGQGQWKKIGGYTFWLGSLALFSTQSIGGLVGFLAILLLAVFCFVKSHKKRLVLLAGVCAFACILYVLFPFISPAHTQEYIESDASTRLFLWVSAWNLFTQSPVMGVGWGNFTDVYGLDFASFEPGKVAAHNIYLQLLSETGLVGFGAFLYLAIQSWRQARRQLSSSVDFLEIAVAFGVLGALLSVLVHGCVDFLFHVNAQFGTLFWTLLALLVASGRFQCNPKVDGMSVSGEGHGLATGIEMTPRTAVL
jgi:O-antigen ligase